MSDNIFSMTFEVIKKGFKNRKTWVMAILAPIIAMMILGYLVSVLVAVEPVQIGIVNMDKGMGNVSASSTIIDELRGQENITLVSLGGESDIEKNMKDKKIDGALVFGENFTPELIIKKSSEINISLEGTDQTKSALISKAVNNASLAAAAKLQGSTGSPLKINMEKVYGNDLDVLDMIMTNIIALITLILSSVISTLTMLSFKGKDFFSHMLKSPVKATAAYVMGISVFTFITALIILSYAIFITGITIDGSFYNIAILTLFIALIGTSIGVFVTSVTRSDWQAIGLLIPIIVVQYLFGGIVVAVSKFHAYVQVFSYILPMTYASDAIKSLAIRNCSWGDVWIDLLALFIIFILLLTFSIVGLKYQSRSQ
ncbi:MAG: ABC-2 family transporter protein [Methanobacterium sp. PtaU1.Bin242]|nr:MAG: ABC-2 family transporter protein [Methanobacterium sp. PtaU1.Bin242]